MATLQLVAADRQNRTILLRVLKFNPQQENELSDTLLKGDSLLHTCGAFWFVEIGEYINFDELIWHVRELESKYGKIIVPLLSLNSSPDQCKELNKAFEDMENSPENCEVSVADEEIPESGPFAEKQTPKLVLVCEGFPIYVDGKRYWLSLCAADLDEHRLLWMWDKTTCERVVIGTVPEFSDPVDALNKMETLLHDMAKPPVKECL